MVPPSFLPFASDRLLCGCTKQDFTYIDAKQGVARVYCTMRGADGTLIADSNGSVASVGSGFFVGPWIRIRNT